MESVKSQATNCAELAARRVAAAAPTLKASQTARLRELLMAPGVDSGAPEETKTLSVAA